MEVLFRWRGPQTRRHRADLSILVVTMSLVLIGLIIQYVIGPALTSNTGLSENHFFLRHSISICLGLVALLAAWKIPLKTWINFSPLILGLGIVASFLTIAINGTASRWIQIGFFSFQPVELLKVGLILAGAGFLVELKRRKPAEEWGTADFKLPIIIMGIAALAIVVLQRDLGSMAVLAGIGIAMLWVSGFSLKKFLLFSIAVAVIGSFFIASTPYRRERLATFLNPQEDCLDEGYQACQALISVGSGGLLGRGVGKSVQVYGYLPEANNDSIFAIYAEIIGYAGVLVLFGLLYKLYSVIYRIARYSEDTLLFVSVGILAWFSVQSIINIGAMIGLLPLKGITLPFISYGGSSMMLVLFATGILLQTSAYTIYGNERLKTNQNSPGGRRVRRTRIARR